MTERPTEAIRAEAVAALHAVWDHDPENAEAQVDAVLNAVGFARLSAAEARAETRPDVTDDDLVRWQRMLDEARAELAEARARVAELEKQVLELRTWAAAVEDAGIERDRLRARVAELEAELASLRRDVDAGFQAVREQRDEARAKVAAVEALISGKGAKGQQMDWPSGHIVWVYRREDIAAALDATTGPVTEPK